MGPNQHGKRPLSRQGCHQDPPVKRRASQACLSCRNRKVRCDVVNGGMPCTNCRLDNVRCEVKETQRGRRPCSGRPSKKDTVTRPAKDLERNEIPQQDAQDVIQAQMTLEDEDEQEEGDAEGDSEADEGSLIYCQPSRTPTTQQHSHSENPELSNCDEEQLPEEANGHAARLQSAPISPFLVMSTPPRPGSQQHQIPQQPQRNSRGHQSRTPLPHGYHLLDRSTQLFPEAIRKPGLPLYIQPIPKHLDHQDVEYMESKHCLEIPDDELRDELLRVYVSIVYPLLPAVEIDEFIEAVMANDGRNPISLLLFQSIMFVSVAFVDTEYLLARGYSSHKAARKDFFNRVRILYSLNYEKDRVALTQSLLAMTYWYDAPDDDKDTWYWMGVALTTAQVAGFHRDPSSAVVAPRLREARLQRRIWWCCFMRDLFLALGLRRPPRIRDTDYTVTMLCEADFNFGTHSATFGSLFRSSKFPCPDQTMSRELAAMSVELARLCVTAGHMLQTQYTSAGAYYGGSEYLGSHKPKRTSEQIATLAQCAAELSDWIQHQNARAPYVPGDEQTSSDKGDERGKIIRFHRIQLHMHYLAALGALRRPSVFCQGPTQRSHSEQTSLSAEVVLDPAIEMVKLAFDLQHNDQLRYLTTLAVPAYLAVSLVHLLDSRQGEEETRNLSLGRLYQSVYVLQKLQSIYSSADYAICFLRSILANTKLRIPLLWMDDAATSRRQDAPATKISMEMAPDEVAAACMYPSPSASAQLNKPVGDSPMGSSSPPVGVDQWELPWEQDLIGGIAPFHELVAGSPFLGNWCDSDGMMPTAVDMGGTAPGFSGDISSRHC